MGEGKTKRAPNRRGQELTSSYYSASLPLLSSKIVFPCKRVPLVRPKNNVDRVLSVAARELLRFYLV